MQRLYFGDKSYYDLFDSEDKHKHWAYTIFLKRRDVPFSSEKSYTEKITESQIVLEIW